MLTGCKDGGKHYNKEGGVLQMLKKIRNFLLKEHSPTNVLVLELLIPITI